jgi:hypothetical protein
LRPAQIDPIKWSAYGEPNGPAIGVVAIECTDHIIDTDDRRIVCDDRDAHVAAAAYALVMLDQQLDMLGQQANPCVPARRFAPVDTSVRRC